MFVYNTTWKQRYTFVRGGSAFSDGSSFWPPSLLNLSHLLLYLVSPWPCHCWNCSASEITNAESPLWKLVFYPWYLLISQLLLYHTCPFSRPFVLHCCLIWLTSVVHHERSTFLSLSSHVHGNPLPPRMNTVLTFLGPTFRLICMAGQRSPPRHIVSLKILHL